MGKQITVGFIHSFVPCLTNISNFSVGVAFTLEGPTKMAHEAPTVSELAPAAGVAGSLLSALGHCAPAADGSPFSSRCQGSER